MDKKRKSSRFGLVKSNQIMSDNVAFHKQSLQMMETAVLMFQIGGSQLAGTTLPTWQDLPQIRGLHSTPKTAKQSQYISKKQQSEISISLYIKNSMHLKKKEQI